jgi:oligopeptide/dipeptide ABC transporter ATP-binding protein
MPPIPTLNTDQQQHQHQLGDDLLRVEDLKTHFFTPDGIVRAVDGVSFTIGPQEVLGVVGESGCGKSMTAYSLLKLLPIKSARIVSGQMLFRRRDSDEVVDLAALDPQGNAIREIRGNEIAMIFQEPMTSLSPVHTIGNQIIEAIRIHDKSIDQKAAEQRAISLLERVGIAGAAQRLHQYPHELSGGLRQRAMIAMALSCNPRLLLADEPTTALDVTIQAQILDLLRELQAEFKMAILLITHNLGVISEMADRVAVMYMGRVVETADVRTILRRPMHPYTVGLMRSMPKLGAKTGTPLTPIAGRVPDPFSVPKGCAFYPRCPAAKSPACFSDVPLREVEPGHWVRCTLWDGAAVSDGGAN